MPDTDEDDVLVAAARHQVGLLPVEDLPGLAAGWLADGLDSSTLRELAGLSRDDRSAAELWPDVLAELGVTLPVTDARRVIAPWAARRVLDGERDVAWLVEQLLGRIPFDDVDDLVSLLYGLDHCLETIAQPFTRGVQEVADVLRDARAEADRIVWLLARLDPRADVRPLPPPRRDQVLLEAAVRAVRDDLRRISSGRWSIDMVEPGSWTLSSPTGSTILGVTASVDPEALPPGIEHEHLTQEFVDEATSHVGDAVLHALGVCGAGLRCRVHSAPLMVCSELWVCDSSAVHDLSEVGSLRRRDAELRLTE